MALFPRRHHGDWRGSGPVPVSTVPDDLAASTLRHFPGPVSIRRNGHENALGVLLPEPLIFKKLAFQNFAVGGARRDHVLIRELMNPTLAHGA